jgi:D-cysteine desulfhydrase
MEVRTPVYKLNSDFCKELYVKREDMIPYSFGGNKARKAVLFFDEIDRLGADYVVTYGSSHSNHCRVIANMAAQRGLKCLIIGPSEVSDPTYNSKLMDILGAEIITVPVDEVKDTIDARLEELRKAGHDPYFIMGGGHGNIGTRAYVQCYREIKEFEKENSISFDYIFLASGTGTTQAGLVCGQLLEGDDKKIIGISIARKNPRGRDVVIESIRDYLKEEPGRGQIAEDVIQENTIFLDEYTGDGYGRDNKEITKTIEKALVNYGMPLDCTYTGKAFWGMEQYVRRSNLSDKKILFIHTGGTPLFFDELDKMRR